MNAPAEMKLREFAAHLGKKASYITLLKSTGRLVLSADGKRVCVAESIQRISNTMDPSKSGVAAYHASKRGEGEGGSSPDGEIIVPELTGFELPVDRSYQGSRARREHFAALSAERDYKMSMGTLMHADDVLPAVAGAISTLRQRLEALPDILAPQLTACGDESQARILLADTIEHALEEAARQFLQLSKPKEKTA